MGFLLAQLSRAVLIFPSHDLELCERLDRLSSSRKHSKDIETNLNSVLGIGTYAVNSSLAYGLAQWPALADCDLITFLHTECWRDVYGSVLVSLLVTRVLGDEVEVLAANDESTVHLRADDSAGHDTSTDRDQASEGALLVCGTT